MATVRSFAGYRYARDRGFDFAKLVAPPYDVLDQAGKDALASDPHNIVHVDLPHMPPKTLGPDSAYQSAAATLKGWIEQGVIKQDRRACFYPYEQTFAVRNRKVHRRGFFTLVKLSPFGEGEVVPHEKTYKGPIEDRLRLMHATKMALSPVFGLFDDPGSAVTARLFENMGRPDMTAIQNGVKNDLWSVFDNAVELDVIDAMKGRPIYIADGHHRYTTALQYKADVEKRLDSPLPENHPAGYALFVLVGMQETGLVVLPTHRLIGGLTGFSIEKFVAAMSGKVNVRESATPAGEALVDELPEGAIGLYDGATKKTWVLEPVDMDLLKPSHGGQSEAWRRLDVAVVQHYLIERVLAPTFAGGNEPAKGYTADADEVAAKVTGGDYQIALILRPTPVGALEALGRHNEVMPQKSTYFYPKLATGLVMAGLEMD